MKTTNKNVGQVSGKMTLVLYTILLILLLFAAVADIRARIIPNRYPAAILLLFPAAAAFGTFPDWPWHLLVFAASFAVCLGLFAAGLLGGGDAKLLPATALWAGPEVLPVFLLITATAGGVLALALLARHRLQTPARIDGASASPPTVPYGVAIAAGGAVVAAQPLLNAFSPGWSVVSASGV